MLYMVELRYAEEHRDEALGFFWKHGSILYDSKVTVKEVWVATQDRVAYALVEAADPEAIAKASKPLGDFGDVRYRHVNSAHEL